MSEPYTPDIDNVRDIWVDHELDELPRGIGTGLVPEMQDRFDRMIADVTAQAVTAEREKVVAAIAEVDKSPAVTWAGHGGAREVLRRALAGAHDGGAES